MKRFIYTIINAFKYRVYLYNLKDKKHQIKDVFCLTKLYLKELEISCLVLDYDGVLAPHGENVLCETILQHLSSLSEDLGPGRIYILSNKPSLIREEMFKKNLPNIKFIRASRKKPYPDGLNEIISVSEIDPSKICLVDDRLLTGCLSSIISGCYPILLTNPLINKNKNRLNEVFFNILRFIEQKIFLR